jgi:predicted adenine nucleotide alpha hydrolase (AANH) superfamily ATPase
MKLLLHACCADCALKFLESAKNENIEVTIFYYNPNIHPRAEYSARLKAMQQICTENKVKIIIPDWRPREYFESFNLSALRASPLDRGDLEKPNRCIKCWNLRLEATAKYAKQNRFEAFSSTLVTSEYQDQDKIEKIALEKAKKYDIKFWKPKEVVKELKTSGFYKQFFCGCVYSLKERYEEKYRG